MKKRNKKILGASIISTWILIVLCVPIFIEGPKIGIICDLIILLVSAFIIGLFSLLIYCFDE